MREGITKAAYLAGGQVALAAKLNVRQQSVSEWVKIGYVPVGRADEISAIVDGRVPPEDLIAPALRRILESMMQKKVGAGEAAMVADNTNFRAAL